MYSAYTKFFAASCTQPLLIQRNLKLGEGVVASGVQIKHFFNKSSSATDYFFSFLVYFRLNSLCFASLVAYGLVAKRGLGWKPALRNFFLLSLAYLFCKVSNVFFGKHYLNIPTKLLIGFCPCVDNEVCFDEVYLSLWVFFEPVIDRHSVFEVSCK